MKFTPSNQVAETTQAQLRRQFRTGLNDILGSAKLLELQAPETERENIQQILTTSRELLALIDEKLPVSGSDVLTGQSVPSESISAQRHVLYVEDHDANFRLVGRILQFDNRQGQAIDEHYNVQSARRFGPGDGKLIDD